MNPDTCNGGPGCLSTAVARATGQLDVANDIYIGLVPQLTPFIRSKLITTKGMNGCIGVSIGVLIGCMNYYIAVMS